MEPGQIIGFLKAEASFQSGVENLSCEVLSHPCILGAIEIPSTTPGPMSLAFSANVVIVKGEKRLTVYELEIQGSAPCDDRAELKNSCELLKPVWGAFNLWPALLQFLSRYEELSGRLIAELLDPVISGKDVVETGKPLASLSQP